MKMQLLLTAVIACGVVHSHDVFSESLDIFQLPGGFYLNNFTFRFDADRIQERIDYMPIHFSTLIKSVPELEFL